VLPELLLAIPFIVAFAAVPTRLIGHPSPPQDEF
jgi:hypothetical protein